MLAESVAIESLIDEMDGMLGLAEILDCIRDGIGESALTRCGLGHESAVDFRVLPRARSEQWSGRAADKHAYTNLSRILQVAIALSAYIAD